jgi:hypothetical protein
MSDIKCRGAARQVMALAGVWALGCAEPSFVSLGRNISAVTGEDDAGATPSLYGTGDAGSSPEVDPDDLSEFNPMNATDPFDIRAIDPCEPAGENVALEVDCAGSQLLQCPAPTIGDPYPLAASLSRLLESCQGWDTVVRVRFEGGCATSFDLSGSVTVQTSACVLQHLSSERYDCARAVACGAGRALRVLTR